MYDPQIIRKGLREDPHFAREIWGEDIVHVREIMRQQILGDRELLRDIDSGRERRAEDRAQVEARLWFCERVALYTGLELPPALPHGTDVLAELR
jgi:hypothetical protein